jgi:phosphoribosylanthranilate isomerase
MVSTSHKAVGIKICGLVRPEDVEAINTLDVQAIGLVFYEKSPRFVSIQHAAVLRQLARPDLAVVGLFVNASLQQISEVQNAVNLDVLQFHGDESPEQCEAVAGELKRPYWRAVRMQGANDLPLAAAGYPGAQALLLDAHVSGYGGSGKSFDWNWIAPTRPAHWPPLVMSGGLTPENVAQAVLNTSPWMLDVSSGVQGDSARAKDLVKMKRFIAAARFL